MDSFALRQRYAIIFIRVAAAAMMITHGVARISLGIVDDFGGFFDAIGFPLGLYLAWAITIFEILGGLTMAAGYFVTTIACLFIVQLIFGIALIHAREGWFVVGAGRNGMEFSVLLIAALFAVAYSHYGKPDMRGRYR